MKQDSLLKAYVVQHRRVSPSVVELVLRAVGEGALPPADAGAHIDVHLPNGLVRQYSLVDPVRGGGDYRIGVRVMKEGRGGSRCVSETLGEGSEVLLGAPRNLFELRPASRPIVLVAGGIGITPIHAMAQSLMWSGHDNWALHYAFTRSDDSYFPSDWLLGHERVHCYEAQPAGNASGRVLNVDALVGELEAGGGGDIYCCGPTSLMDSLSARCAQSPSIHYVQETFVAPDLSPAGDESAFTVVLAKSGRSVRVDVDQSILEVLRGMGVDAPYSCGQGVCGACETAVLAGKPLHRDAILSPSEQEAGATMMICCSRSVTPSLTLDI